MACKIVTDSKLMQKLLKENNNNSLKDLYKLGLDSIESIDITINNNTIKFDDIDKRVNEKMYHYTQIMYKDGLE